MTTTLKRARWQDEIHEGGVYGGACDAIICDPPYGTKTHSSYSRQKRSGGLVINDISYAPWSAADVGEFVSAMAPRCRGWWVVLTSHDLAPSWEDSLSGVGLYVFAPLPFVSPGSRIRLVGDGPSSWTCWIMVARPRGEPYNKWGTLPGAYVVNKDLTAQNRGDSVMGGKPLALMQALVRDYTRPGDTVWDPFCGAGTTAVACESLGRHCATTEEREDHYEIARSRLARGVDIDMFQA